ncbi:hypothetical protein [Streptococcus catagoni]|uniref:hypothetical protein n=1 Tax=Streptococcus catagoni TaxID=2654874 RepID=UPI001408A66A|nr:hypothetical protein [Streptococcus catagoni]
MTSGKTDKDGKIQFDKLPLSRNLAVYVDGISQGYTVRTSEAGSSKDAAFFLIMIMS